MEAKHTDLGVVSCEAVMQCVFHAGARKCSRGPSSAPLLAHLWRRTSCCRKDVKHTVGLFALVAPIGTRLASEMVEGAMPPDVDDGVWDDRLNLAACFSGIPECCVVRDEPETVPFGEGLFDSHCHPGSMEVHPLFADVRAKTLVMGTNEADWTCVVDACGHSTQLSLPGFGIHPWYAHAVAEGWLERLRALLEHHPHALVGEVGLDKIFRTKETRKCEYQAQQVVFQAQLKLAADLCRPVSVHCVQSWGKMAEILEQCAKAGSLPPAIALHSWGGPPEWVNHLINAVGVNYPLFFGFSDVINSRGQGRLQRLEGNLCAVPSDRVLLETDVDTPSSLDSYMNSIRGTVSSIKGWTPDQTAEITMSNAHRFAHAHDAS